MKKYKVALPISVTIGGKETVYQHGSIAELDDATAKLYSHALIAIEEKETTDGGHS